MEESLPGRDILRYYISWLTRKEYFCEGCKVVFTDHFDCETFVRLTID